MSELSRIYGPPPDTNVNKGGYRLCKGCSRGVHRDHTSLERCSCDLCTEETPA